ncbi:MAG: peptidyl-prolyl cis-trans isomerase D [Saprospiraceae bacterium]|jgi:peptidyl-prolyl cis-trans isomerase D
MAVFQKIRDNSLLSLIVIGGGLFLFIIGDSLSSSAPSITDSVGSFEGQDISQGEFDNYYSTILYLNGKRNTKSSLTDQEKQQFSNQTWSQLLMKKIFESEADKNGINITDSEIDEMLAGENPSQFFVGRLFGGAQNYQSIRQELSDDVENYSKFAQVRSYEEAELIKNFGISLRKQEKLMSLVKNSFFTTSSESLDLYNGKYAKKSVTIGTIPYYLVSDSLVEVSEQEIKEFYNKNKGKYKLLQPSKKVIYAAYRIDPSVDDDQYVLTWAKETVKLFAEEENDELFVRTESETPFDNAYYKKGGGLALELDNKLFEQEKGFVYGPYSGYSDGNKTYSVAKIIDVQHMPDSAKVSQVLLTPEKRIEALLKNNPKPEQEEVQTMWASFDTYVDSVYNELTSGSNFTSTAAAVSVDSASAEKGGDLGWIQDKSPLYAPQFLDSVFMESESSSSVKKIKIVTQNGGYYYYQLVKVDKMGEKSKKLKIGIVSKSVLPRNKTRDGYFNKINQVAIALNDGKNLIELRDSFKFTIDSVKLEPQQYLVNDLKGARSLVHWAFNTAEGNQCKVFDFDRKYVVAKVVDETNRGYQSLGDEEVKNEIREKVMKIKKAAYIAEKLGDVTDATLTDLASLFNGSSVETIENVLTGVGVPKLSYESSLTGVIYSLESGSVSTLVVGLDAAYIVKSNSEVPAIVTEETNFDLESNQLNQQNRSKTEFVLQELISDKADVEDSRSSLQ